MPFADQSGKDGYERLKTDIPTEQPLRFILGHAKAAYLPREDTDDESTHYVPQQVVDQVTRRRIMQPAIIRLGDASSFSFRLYFIDGQTGLPADLSELKMFSFNGRNAHGHWIRDDNGFDTTNANIGQITWTPPEEIANVPGYYKSAQFLIESQDRSQVYATLEFSLLVINNDVARPRELNWHLDEYLRLMYHLFEMQDNADEHISYLLKFADTRVDSNLTAQAKKVAAALDTTKQQLQEIVTAFQNKINDFEQKQITQQQVMQDLDTAMSQLKAQEANFELDLQQRLNNLQQKIDSKNIVTIENLQEEVAKQIEAQDEIQNEELRQFIHSEGGDRSTLPPNPPNNGDSNNTGADNEIDDPELAAFVDQEGGQKNE